MPAPPLRIAILECDTPVPAVVAKHGAYDQIFTSLLRAAADALCHPGLSASSGLDITAWDVVSEQSYPAHEDIDAVLITGSKYNSFDNDPWILKLVDFTKQLLEQRRVRILGVCFGHQILGRALGVDVGRSDGGWEVSVTAMDLTKRGQEIFGKTSLALHQMHRDAIFTYPEGVEALASTDKCSTHAMYAAGRFISVQGHPEFTGDIMREILKARHAQGIFDEELYKDGSDRVDRHQDGVVVAQAFLKFLLEE
ncbi:putative glutamine amidotransferase class-I [Diplocarpon rosae]|nr:putative glutamine amidotransferase class-I [Diplocarpon rosae]